jgi:hypothetical protein
MPEAGKQAGRHVGRQAGRPGSAEEKAWQSGPVARVNGLRQRSTLACL